MIRRAAGRGLMGLIGVSLLLALLPGLGRLLYPVPYRGAVEQAAAETGLDPYLIVSVMRVESGFNPRAVSPRGARGLMQVMPETGAWVARQLGVDRFHPDQLFDPETSLRFGAWYLAHLQKVFGGRLAAALAAYNGGQANVRQWLETRRWDGRFETAAQIPFTETRTYVQRVNRAYRSYRLLYRGRWSGIFRPRGRSFA